MPLRCYFAAIITPLIFRRHFIIDVTADVSMISPPLRLFVAFFATLRMALLCR